MWLGDEKLEPFYSSPISSKPTFWEYFFDIVPSAETGECIGEC